MPLLQKVRYYKEMLIHSAKLATVRKTMLRALRQTPLFVPGIIVFSVLLFPFVGLVPYLDGDVEFLISVNFYAGKYLSNWMPYHPPLKPFIASTFFHLFGFSSYSLIGYLFGVAGIVAIYVIGEQLFGKRTGFIAAFILSLSGIYIASALFSLNDFLMAVCILCSFACYVKKRYVWASVFACIAVMSKESAILFPLCIIAVELVKKEWRSINFLPFVVLLFWVFFLHVMGHSLWNSWNFSPTPQAGSFVTIEHNIISGSILNQYAYENWLHLFLFNYNWVLWLVAIPAFWLMKWNKYLSIIILFMLTYTILILSFQTFTIPRYILPMLVFLYVFVGVTLANLRLGKYLIPIVMMSLLVSLFTSSDLISNMIWQKWQILDQAVYINRPVDGNDGVTYNMQFLYLTKARNTLIKSGHCAAYMDILNISPETVQTMQLPPCH